MKHVIQGKRLVRFALLSTFLIRTPTAVQLRITLKHQSKTCMNGFAKNITTLDAISLTMMITMFHRESSSGLSF